MSNRPNDPDDDFRDFMEDDEDRAGQDEDLFDEFDREETDLDSLEDFPEGEEIGADEFEDGQVEPRQGPSRTFLIVAGILIVLLLLGFGLLAAAILVPREGPFEQTSTAIALTNAQVALLLTETSTAATAQAIENATIQAQGFMTQTAEAGIAATQTAQQLTADAAASQTAQSLSLTQTAQQLTADAAASQTALANSLTQTAAALTLTAGGVLPTPVTPSPTSGVSENSVQLTATRLAEILLTQGAGTPIPVPTGGPVPTAAATELPDGGLFDDLGAGPGTLLMAGLALLGVIFLSRGLRAVNSNR